MKSNTRTLVSSLRPNTSKRVSFETHPLTVERAIETHQSIVDGALHQAARDFLAVNGYTLANDAAVSDFHCIIEQIAERDRSTSDDPEDVAYQKGSENAEAAFLLGVAVGRLLR